MELEPSGLLFTHRVARGGELTVTIDALDADDELWASAQALFALVAWDLHEGLVGVGGATTRGYGTLTLLDPDEGERRAAQAALRRLRAQAAAGGGAA